MAAGHYKRYIRPRVSGTDYFPKGSMVGSIRTLEKCACGRPFVFTPRKGLYCKPCDRHPRRLYLRLYIKGFGKKNIFSDHDGRPLVGSDYAAAVRLQGKISYDMQHGIFDPAEYVREDADEFMVKKLIGRYLKSSRVANLAPSYSVQHASALDRAKGFLGSRDVRKIKKVDIEDLKALFGSKGQCEKTQLNNVAIFRSFLFYCKDDLEMKDVNVPGLPEFDIPERAPLWLNAEDQAKVFSYCPPEDRYIVSFLMTYGTRVGEARAIKIKNVHWPERMILIQSTFSDNVYRDRRKSKKAKPYPIGIVGPRELDAYIDKRLKEALPEAFLFINPRTGREYHESALRKLWNKMRKHAGLDTTLKLKDATRSSVASQMGIEGIPMQVTQRQLGHADLRTTNKFYTAVQVGQQKDALARLALKKILPWGCNGAVAQPQAKEEEQKISVV